MEVFRSNLPNGPIDYQTFAPNVISGNQESAPNTIYLESTYFRAGVNIITASVRQHRSNSSDLYFDVELLGIDDLRILHQLTEAKKDSEEKLTNDKLAILDKTYQLNEAKAKNDFQRNIIFIQWLLIAAGTLFFGILCYLFYRYYLNR